MGRSRPPHLDRLALFAAVAESGGFTAAAARLDTSKTQLSQQIATLERELGTALFTRTTRRVTLTEAGAQLLRESQPALRDLAAAVERLASVRERPSGTLRITAPADYAANVLSAALAETTRRYPDLRVEVIATSEVLDLVAERVDLALRLGWLRNSSLRAVRLGEFEQFVAASPEYLARHGVPQRPEDLTRHRWIALTVLRTPLVWRFTTGHAGQRSVRVEPFAQANSAEVVLGLLRAGIGISVLTDFALEQDLRSGALRRVLPQWKLPRGGIYAVYPSARHVPAKVRAFIEVLRGVLA